MRESVIYQDILQQGIQQGIQREKERLALNMLGFGTIWYGYRASG